MFNQDNAQIPSFDGERRSPVSQQALQETFIGAMQRVYLWMTMGLGLTAIVAWYVSQSEFFLNLIFGSSWTVFGLLIVELALVFAVMRIAFNSSPTVALGLFLIYSALNGATLSAIFIVYDFGTITTAFVTTAALFGVMSIIGFTTKQDLTKWGPILFIGLIGIIIASVVNYFLQSPMLDWIISYLGVAIFLGLTVYDTKWIKQNTLVSLASGNQAVVASIGVVGALKLYLDFINLFLFLLRIFGGRRR